MKKGNFTPNYPPNVTIVEVGPRDGLQNEARTAPLDVKLEWITQLAASGLPYIEVGSFVSPRWVPQMADTAAVISALPPSKANYAVLIPNEAGLQRAIQVGAQHFSIFTASSNTFTKKNINCTIDESLERFIPIAKYTQHHNIPLRGYLSCAVACPYEGAMDPQQSAAVAKALIDLGCYEVSLGDTIGVATPNKIIALLDACTQQFPMSQLALHCHDTYGQALANIYAGLCYGVSVFDASVAGLGGCPYAPGASGNVATEDVVYLMQGLGIDTGIDLKRLINAGHAITRQLNIANRSKTALSNIVTTCPLH